SYFLKDEIRSTCAKVRVYIGENETAGIRRSAMMITEKIPKSEMNILMGMYHGQFSMNRPGNYVEAVKDLIKS
ncbi:MAG: alpha/beta hydrolase, partial [Eubacteriaceae bacterium]|nr:alpha/beta hydrolase [Eubacteriaceae bacterium]